MQSVREHGWHVMGVGGGHAPDWAYSIGLWHSHRSPEVCLAGVPLNTAMQLVNIIGGQIRDGRPLAPDERRDDVINGYPVAIRPVHPGWYKALFGAGLDYARQPPWPMVQAFWPDKSGLFPWEKGFDEGLREAQPLLWLPRAEHPAGAWTEEDPTTWPFHPTLPYHSVLTTEAVLAGEPVGMVARDPGGTWYFVEAGAQGPGDVEVPLRRIVNLHDDVVATAGLQPGTWVQRGADGAWPS